MELNAANVALLLPIFLLFLFLIISTYFIDNNNLITSYLTNVVSRRYNRSNNVSISVKPQPVFLFFDKETDNSTSDCSNETVWPSLELLLPLAPSFSHITEFRQFFLPSYALFWPIKRSNTTLLIITDEEAKNGREAAEIQRHLSQQLVRNTFRMIYNTMPRLLKTTTLRGYDRQQWLMFWADNFTTADYVGFIDSDAVLVTRVTLTDLFDPEKGRPIIRPLYGKPQSPLWAASPHITFRAIGRKTALECMTYFPVIIKVAHLALIRAHITRHLNVTYFDEAFLLIMLQRHYSQFDIFCSYLWYYRRNDYYWAISPRVPNWTGGIPYGQVFTMAEAGITQVELRQHSPRVAIHWTYDYLATHQKNAFKKILKNGVCYSMPVSSKKRPKYCKSLVKTEKQRMTSLNVYEWMFEGYLLTFPENLRSSLAAHQRRLTRNDKCLHEWNETLLSELMDKK